MRRSHDLVVLGSGFAGSLFAMVAVRLGLSVLLVERGRHPRFVIGESSTPLSNLLLEQLADRYDLPFVRSLSKWGTWQAQHPGLPCGLKRGFSFFHHHREGAAASAAEHPPLLVAANPHDAAGDTHWYRSAFDHALVEQARALGVDYVDETRVMSAVPGPEHVDLVAERDGEPMELRARFVVDASGTRGCLHHLLALSEAEPAAAPPTQCVYSHFTDVASLELPAAAYPYPPEQAAVHHLFEGGWIWVLRFNHGITSAGAVLTDARARSLSLAEGRPAWERLLRELPLLEAQFAQARAVLPHRHVPRLAFQSRQVAGRRWALLPSAASFVDPMLSTGFALTLLGITRLASALAQRWEQPELGESLAEYADVTRAEADATAALIGALYANFANPAAFRAITLLYFAAASYAETAHRLGRPQLASTFLLCKDPRFGPPCAILLEEARRGISAAATPGFTRRVHALIEPFDVAGLSAHRDVPWYPVDADDLRRSAWKLGATPVQVDSMLQRSGFFPAAETDREAGASGSPPYGAPGPAAAGPRSPDPPQL